MLKLYAPAALEGKQVPIGGEAHGIPKAHGLLHAQLVLKGTQGRVRVQGPIAPRRASETVLEEHANDGHHSQTAIRQLRVQALPPQVLVLRGQQRGLPAGISRVAPLTVAVVAEATRALTEQSIQDDLHPSCTWHLGDGSQAVRDVLKLQICSWGEIARKLTRDLRRDVAHGRQHGDPAMLQLGLTPALEVLNAAIGGVADGIPEAQRRLHTQLVLKGSQRRVCVESPISIRGSSQSILEEHSHDRHHCQAAIRQLSVQLPGLGCRVRGREHLEAKVAISTWSAGRLVR
mmetsp:Transcript_81182/g.205187  ORF Transcript_81182/g.205187 Transcript_81182/m.205187 type:complete len:289 (-) Transcript_81182:343-1209(-)